jgi:myo-inositol-1(or 4)-monophosphatase
MEDFIAAADDAAHAAASLILAGWQQSKEIHYKSAIDLVTSVDRACEERIVEILQRRFPDHSILAEEQTSIVGEPGGYRWIIDPLDGTTNFAHAYPHFCVSIALELNSDTLMGLVYDPVHNEKFRAVKGQGAFLNDQRIATSKVAELEKALLVTGFPYDRRERTDFYLAFWKAFMMRCQGVRRNGSAALDLCYLACSRVDGFWEFGLHPWDTAAGGLIVRESGGQLSDFSGGEFSIWKKEILATNSLIHAEMLAAIMETRARFP